LIQSYVELGESNLSRHLSALEAAGYIKITKVFEGKKPRTWVSLTPCGREAFIRHVNLLREIVGEPPGKG
jgi:DNA-binding PadR family transcriptional regulator